MRIVSQDRCTDIDYSHNHLYLCDEDGETTIESREDILGSYNTKERALEVMKEIREQDVALKIWEIRVKNILEEDLTFVGSKHLPKIMELSIYYMPKE
jgi:hypothetical protein